MDITEEQFSTLNDSQKSAFVKSTKDPTVYTMTEKLITKDDLDAIKTAKEHEVENSKAIKAELVALKEKNEALATTDGRNKEQLAEIEKQYQDKISNLEKEAKDRIEAANERIKKMSHDELTTKLSVDLAGENAEVIAPHIHKRLQAELGSDGKVSVKVLDAEGDLTISSPDDLKEEFLANAKFAPILVGSKAAGGGAPEPSLGGGAPSEEPNLAKDANALKARVEARIKNGPVVRPNRQ